MTIYQCSLCGTVHDNTKMCAQTFVVPIPRKPWPEELRERCLAAGYGDVLIGQCDVEGLDANRRGFCRQVPHGEGPMMPLHASEAPAIWAILEQIGVPYSSASCHLAGLNRTRMTPEQREAVKDRPYWVRERKGA